MDLIVHDQKTAEWRGQTLRCAVGRGGISVDKREGDGATPTGRFAFRRALYRPDRLIDAPVTGLPRAALSAEDGWCDDPTDTAYNQQIRLPYEARHERLWREDGLYDLIVVLGHNDRPVIAGLGSGIFLHVAAPGFTPTEGCIALGLDDLLGVLRGAVPGDGIQISVP
ncbi:MAG: L,D-transpeptidase family protein [Alphaproteobacteria bacterium]